ncbi:CTLH LisH motif, WD40/YVTN repeat-like-containing domain, Topless family [Artemisia annua]|uniref:CTLH LisH motif, WD40/YVTN repeat-like-containing domain, Topless family n=1 Tax=Artemisia annua TaxID=35608 RepID=A0A2U1PC47_ARTAN|nr:CTLH LisH motif, WD40/YVTN repeat-like-containing domain, Topless family [Artemisia annua]
MRQLLRILQNRAFSAVKAPMNTSVGPSIMDRVTPMPSTVMMNDDLDQAQPVLVRLLCPYPLLWCIYLLLPTFMPPPPAATFLAFHPLENNIIAIGMEDSSIQIYNVRVDELKKKLKGYKKRITGLAFLSRMCWYLLVLILSCVFGIQVDGKSKQSKQLQIPAGRVSAKTHRVQFHKDQTRLLAVHETQIAVYEAPKLESPKQLFPPKTSGLITHATYSCDSQSIFVGFEDGSVAILASSTLTVRVHPLVIAAHPHEADQFALGLGDGGVCVLEPLESEGTWGTSPLLENGAGPSGTTPVAASTANY